MNTAPEKLWNSLSLSLSLLHRFHNNICNKKKDAVPNHPNDCVVCALSLEGLFNKQSNMRYITNRLYNTVLTYIILHPGASHHFPSKQQLCKVLDNTIQIIFSHCKPQKYLYTGRFLPIFNVCVLWFYPDVTSHNPIKTNIGITQQFYFCVLMYRDPKSVH